LFSRARLAMMAKLDTGNRVQAAITVRDAGGLTV
jgi:hypothetical protein